jgi:hypothetical protein
MRKDLDVFKMVQTLYKLKSSIKVIASKMKDPNILKDIQESFVREVIINSSDEELELPDNDIHDFLNRDEKRALFDKDYEVFGGLRRLASLYNPGDIKL